MNFDNWNILIVNKDLTPKYYGIISDKPGLHISRGIQYPLFARKGQRVKFKSRFQNFFGDWIDTEYGNGYPSDLDGNYIINCKKELNPPPNSLHMIESICYELNTRYGKYYFMETTEDGLPFSSRIWHTRKKKIYFLDPFTFDKKEVTEKELKKLMRFN